MVILLPLAKMFTGWSKIVVSLMRQITQHGFTKRHKNCPHIKSALNVSGSLLYHQHCSILCSVGTMAMLTKYYNSTSQCPHLEK